MLRPTDNLNVEDEILLVATQIINYENVDDLGRAAVHQGKQ